MSSISIVTAATHEPLTLDEVKDHLRIERDNVDEDAYLWALIQAAREACEDFTGRFLVQRTVDYTVDGFPSKAELELRGGRLQSITSVTYIDSDDASATFASSNWFADTSREHGFLVLNDSVNWPTATLRPRAAVTVRFVAGFGTAADVPTIFKAGMLLDIGAAFANRQDEVLTVGGTRVELTRTSQMLWYPYKLARV